MSDNTYDYFAMANAAAADVPIVKLANGLQQIEDPRLRLFTLALFFHITCKQQLLDPIRLLRMLDVSVKNAYKQDTAEMRGMIDFIRKEMH
jgi:hypothetical protein